MRKKAILSIFILIIFFSCDTQSNVVYAKTELQNKNEINVIKLSDKKLVLGSSQYVDDITIMSKKQGYKTALDQLMNDVENNSNQIDFNDAENNLRLYKLVSSLVYALDYVDVCTHYFRNKLNRTPKSLKELLYLNSKLPVGKRWLLVPVKGSCYHMQGEDGEYNLKFVSADGYCEAVYNKKGILLTEENDPINMGTFNYYALSGEQEAHVKYDIDPYLCWGNSPNSPQKGRDEILKALDETVKTYERNEVKVTVYRNKAINLN